MRVFVGVFQDLSTRIPRVSIFSFLKKCDQLLPFRIIPHNADRQGHRAQRVQVMDGVCAAARNELRFALIENKYGRFPRDTRDLAIDEDVGDKVSQHSDALSLELPDQFRETAHFTCPERIALTAWRRLSATNLG